MRQTSRAVAFLLVLESAQATANAIISSALKTTADFGSQDIITNFNAVPSATAANALTNRQASYQQVYPATWQWDTLQIKLAVWAVTQVVTATTTTVGSGCMGCLNKGGVWCSKTYAYLSSQALQNSVTAAAGYMNVAQSSITDATRNGGAGLDFGSCCATTWFMNKVVGTPSVDGILPDYDAAATIKTGTDSAFGTTPQGSVAPAMTMTTCVAAQNASPTNVADGTRAWGNFTWDITTAAWSSWWCSNGLYKAVSAVTSGAYQANFNQQIASNTNKRLELAQVACPQQATFCGYGSSSATTVGTPITSTPVAFTIDGGSGGTAINYSSKCSWVTYAYALAPTFAVTQTTITTGLTSNWELHTMEFVSGSVSTKGRLLETASSLGFNTATNLEAVGTNLVPLFGMPAEAFQSLRTWYGVGSFDLVNNYATNGFQEPANWYAPGQNVAGTTAADTVTSGPVAAQLVTASKQYYGNVANFPEATFYTSAVAGTTQVVPAGSTYGLAGTTKFDLRQVRFMPASAAQNVWAAGSALNTSYSTAVTKYTTAKGVWDAYVAILTANGKQDAFAAMFSPPKAPTVPPLPNLPWTPPKYSGYVAVGNTLKSQMVANGLGTTIFLSDSQPAAGGFWTNQAAAQSSGGWGVFTAQILSFRNGFGRSFGTIGFSGDSKKQAMSQVWNMPWMCTGTLTTAVTQIETAACQATYTPGTNGITSSTGAAATGTNASGSAGGRLVVVVSLWSKGNALSTGSAIPAANSFTTTTQNLVVTFTGSPWSTELQALAAITAPGAPAAAATLSGIAGAQALAASAAAALAVAAALY